MELWSYAPVPVHPIRRALGSAGRHKISWRNRRRCACGFRSLQALVEARDVDDDPHMLADPDFLAGLAGAHRELDLASVDCGDLGLTGDLAPGRRCRQVADIDSDADCALAGIEKTADRIERCVLHDHD